jgi:hypothetical protein
VVVCSGKPIFQDELLWNIGDLMQTYLGSTIDMSRKIFYVDGEKLGSFARDDTVEHEFDELIQYCVGAHAAGIKD